MNEAEEGILLDLAATLRSLTVSLSRIVDAFETAAEEIEFLCPSPPPASRNLRLVSAALKGGRVQ